MRDSQKSKGNREDREKKIGWVWSTFPVVGKLRQGDCKCEASLGCKEKEMKGKKKKRKRPSPGLLLIAVSPASSPGNSHHVSTAVFTFLSPEREP